MSHLSHPSLIRHCEFCVAIFNARLAAAPLGLPLLMNWSGIKGDIRPVTQIDYFMPHTLRNQPAAGTSPCTMRCSKPVSTPQHLFAQGPHARRIDRMVRHQVDKDHRVPIDQAHDLLILGSVRIA